MWTAEDRLDYVGDIYRPPSEARSIILQATVGCSHNRCTFCPSYLQKSFAVKSRQTVADDIRKAARLFPGARRLFVADGDALVLPMDRWEWLLTEIRTHLPWIERVGAYATGKNIRAKSAEELRRLRELGLKILYLGVESGDDETLRYIRKDSTRGELLEAGRKASEAGFKLSVTVLLGIAPPGRSLQHAEATGSLLTAMGPDYVGALSVMLVPGTVMAEAARRGEHPVPKPGDYLAELRAMLAETGMVRGLFMANHASNHLPLQVRMPRDKAAALALLDQALRGGVALKREEHRLL